jgi:hypothetical protein
MFYLETTTTQNIQHYYHEYENVWVDFLTIPTQLC